MNDDFSGKVVIITGASSGIGEATAKLVASKGAKIILGARREDKLQQIGDQIEKDGGEAALRGIWSAVGSMSMCVALLIASEFMPVSLLTPIARDLHATDGMAGQAIRSRCWWSDITCGLLP